MALLLLILFTELLIAFKAHSLDDGVFSTVYNRTLVQGGYLECYFSPS